MQSEELAAQLAHWKERLSGNPEPLATPADRPRPAEMTGRGISRWVSPAPEAAEAARELGRRCDATPFMVMLAAYALALHRLTGQRDLVIGVPVRGRPLPELERIMGLFVNALPLRVRVDPGASFEKLVGVVRDCAIDAFRHPDVPFEQLVASSRRRATGAASRSTRRSFPSRTRGTASAAGETSSTT